MLLFFFCFVFLPAGDCHLTVWSSWSSCQLTCLEGRSFETTGRQARSRAVIIQVMENQGSCPHQVFETQPCKGNGKKTHVYKCQRSILLLTDESNKSHDNWLVVKRDVYDEPTVNHHPALLLPVRFKISPRTWDEILCVFIVFLSLLQLWCHMCICLICIFYSFSVEFFFVYYHKFTLFVSL